LEESERERFDPLRCQGFSLATSTAIQRSGSPSLSASPFDHADVPHSFSSMFFPLIPFSLLSFFSFPPFLLSFLMSTNQEIHNRILHGSVVSDSRSTSIWNQNVLYHSISQAFNGNDDLVRLLLSYLTYSPPLESSSLPLAVRQSRAPFLTDGVLTHLQAGHHIIFETDLTGSVDLKTHNHVRKDVYYRADDTVNAVIEAVITCTSLSVSLSHFSDCLFVFSLFLFPSSLASHPP
jgi:hypothetical protein